MPRAPGYGSGDCGEQHPAVFRLPDVTWVGVSVSSLPGGALADDDELYGKRRQPVAKRRVHLDASKDHDRLAVRLPGFGMTDMWTTTRETVFDPWSAPVNLGSLLNGPGIDQRPYVASDRRTLYFASDRQGGAGGLDLYVSTRERD